MGLKYGLKNISLENLKSHVTKYLCISHQWVVIWSIQGFLKKCGFHYGGHELQTIIVIVIQCIWSLNRSIKLNKIFKYLIIECGNELLKKAVEKNMISKMAGAAKNVRLF